MIYLKTLIGQGASRFCYLHPQDKQKCVKVPKNSQALKDIRREIMINTLLQPVLGDCISSCEKDIIATDKGPGMVCELIRNYDGTVSLPIKRANRTADKGYDVHSLEPSMNLFFEKIIENDIFFFDFNFGNFVFQFTAPQKLKLVYTDVKSLNVNGYLGFLKLDKFISPLARIIMFRRIRRFYRELGLAFPFKELCRRKMFSNFWVPFSPNLKLWEHENRKHI